MLFDKQNVPTEIDTVILNMLGKQDLLTLRSISHSFFNKITPSIFTTVCKNDIYYIVSKPIEVTYPDYELFELKGFDSIPSNTLLDSLPDTTVHLFKNKEDAQKFAWLNQPLQWEAVLSPVRELAIFEVVIEKDKKVISTSVAIEHAHPISVATKAALLKIPALHKILTSNPIECFVTNSKADIRCISSTIKLYNGQEYTCNFTQAASNEIATSEIEQLKDSSDQAINCDPRIFYKKRKASCTKEQQTKNLDIVQNKSVDEENLNERARKRTRLEEQAPKLNSTPFFNHPNSISEDSLDENEDSQQKKLN
ncbi:TPA: hypothetical protein I8Z88_001255 [Legionella pneumophila]|nr:hypothetical protein [Legionella pneumophila]